jgi:CBS domain-containing protein
LKVRDGMSTMVLTIGPTHTLRQAAQMMAARHVGAAVVVDPENAGVGILTERDILRSIARDEDPDAEIAAQHRTEDLVYAAPGWTLDKAAQAMVRGGFRHLVVVEGQEVAGLLSMRDIVRCWSSAGVPERVLPALPARPGTRAHPQRTPTRNARPPATRVASSTTCVTVVTYVIW